LSTARLRNVCDKQAAINFKKEGRARNKKTLINTANNTKTLFCKVTADVFFIYFGHVTKCIMCITLSAILINMLQFSVNHGCADINT
jgi:hypothetical protein